MRSPPHILNQMDLEQTQKKKIIKCFQTRHKAKPSVKFEKAVWHKGINWTLELGGDDCTPIPNNRGIKKMEIQFEGSTSMSFGKKLVTL